MSTQEHIQKKPVANIPAARSHNSFERSFSVQTKPGKPSSDLKTQLSKAARFGHNLSQMSPVQSKAAIQRQEEQEEPEQMKSESTIQRQENPEEEPEQMKSESTIQRQQKPEEEPEQMKSESTIQRQQKPEEEPEQMKSESTIQRQEKPEEEPEQMKSEQNAQTSIQRQPNPAATSPGAGNSMPKALRAKMENSFATDFSNVNIHTESAQAKSIGALAYTQGNNIHFAPGQYNPDSRSGQSLLGHELTHVVQQRAGRVPVPHQSKGAPINADLALEKEADDMGAKAAQGELVQMPGAGGLSVNGASPVQNSTKPVQCFLPLLGGLMSAASGGGGLMGALSGGLGGMMGGGGLMGALSGGLGGLMGGGGPAGGLMGAVSSGLGGMMGGVPGVGRLPQG